MDPVIHLLEEKGLYTPELVRAFVLRQPISRVEAFSEELNATLKQQESEPTKEQDPLAFYNFIASSSLRGDNCQNPSCRLRKARLLGRYATLYADHVTLPLWHEHGGAHPPEASKREVLEGALLTVLELRPAIENGFISLREQNISYCRRHLEQRVPEYSTALKLMGKIAPAIASRFRFVLRRAGDKIHVSIYGPEEFIEHGQNGFLFHEAPQWAIDTLGERASTVVPLETVLRCDLLELVFTRATNDVALHQFYSAHTHLKYLTNLPGEAFFLRSSLGAGADTAESSAYAELSHQIPLLKQLTLTEIVQLRKTEYDAFLVYRAALERTIRARFANAARVSSKEAEDIFKDVLLPDLLKLRAKLNASIKSKKRLSFLKSSVATGVVLTLGMFTGILPAKLAEWGASLAGVNLSREVLEARIAAGELDPEIRSDEMYFLLKASQKLEG